MDLNVDPSLQIDIPDALSERDKVKFTVHTKVSDRITLAVTASTGLSFQKSAKRVLELIEMVAFRGSVANS